jgi:hypothetical protein
VTRGQGSSVEEDGLGSIEIAANELLGSIAARAREIGTRPLTLHWPLVGGRFDRGVLMVGQAVFGWEGNWTAAEAADVATREQIIGDARGVSTDRPDRMNWIDGHRVWNSPFWRVARDVTDAVAPGDGPFYSRLAWANLYPVAPNDVKSNPAGPLLEAQTAPAAKFLDAAIEAIRPGLVLVVGGPYVWPFTEPLRLANLKPAERPLYLEGQRDGVPWIVGQHPGGASRRGYGPRRYAELIVARSNAAVRQ